MPKYRVTVKTADGARQFDLEAKDGDDALRRAADRYMDDRLKEGDYTSFSVTFDIVRYPD